MSRRKSALRPELHSNIYVFMFSCLLPPTFVNKGKRGSVNAPLTACRWTDRGNVWNSHGPPLCGEPAPPVAGLQNSVTVLRSPPGPNGTTPAVSAVRRAAEATRVLGSQVPVSPVPPSDCSSTFDRWVFLTRGGALFPRFDSRTTHLRRSGGGANTIKTNANSNLLTK